MDSCVPFHRVFALAALAGLMFAANGHCTDLQNLPPADGSELYADVAGGALGRSVAIIGDINGDGIDDIAIGAPHDAAPGGHGRVWVLFGRAGGLPATIDLETLDGSNGFELTTQAAGATLGRAVTGIGDFNGDGIDDFAVGAPLADTPPAYNDGKVYVLFGHTGSFPASILVDALDGSDGFVAIGANADARAGFSLAAAGDFDGDGYADLLIGSYSYGYAPTAFTHVLLGAPTWPTEVALGDVTITGRGFRLQAPVTAGAGFAVAGVGDVTGDGVDDILVGAPEHAIGSHGNAGRVYLVPGRAANAAGLFIDLETAPGVLRLDGSGPGHFVGSALAGIGDVNGDGNRDMLIGAPGQGGYVGGAWVVFGGPALASGLLSDLVVSGMGFHLGLVTGYNTNAGAVVAGPGDVDGDGIADLMVAIPGGLPSSAVNREVAIVSGRDAAHPWPAEIDLSGSLVSQRLEGTSQINLAGIGDLRGYVSLAGGGDIDGDGAADMLVGSAVAVDSGTPGAPWGRAWVVYGELQDLIFADGFDGLP